ncbi:hypothetical protein [Pampinifervens florentissimum]|uniref:hypothetical protein n=1 Tax=Pampinifervens florentissimum TaxID=1632019 RepID=UPI0013B48141|nr:hypothetical protein [Hydrogenobacter sp. T-8]QID33857.1 hypothetical protein G3M65_08770 [Hydrogenobacter sp. T-8]
MIAFIVFFILFLLYFYISQELFFKFDYIHSNLLFFAEKALIAVQSGFRVENIGFVYPPIAFVPFLIVNDPLLVSPIISALFSTFLITYLIKTYKTDALSILSISIIMLNPLYLFLSSQRFDVLLFYILLSLSVFYTVRHIETKYSLYIFVAGLLLGITFFVDFRSLFVVPVYFISLFLLTSKENFPYRVAIVVVKITPVVFFLFSWLYLNWIFTGNPLNFIQSPYSFFRSEPVIDEFIQASGSFIRSLYLTLKQLFLNSLLILPYFLVIPYIKRFKLLYTTPLFLVYIVPIFVFYFSIYFGMSFPYMYSSVLFLLFSLVFAFYLRIANSKPYLFSMIIAFLSAFFIPDHSKDLNEKEFIGSLKGRIIPERISIKEDRIIAELLIGYGCKKILSDDAYTFPVVYFTGSSNIFILPHNYTYYTALSNPITFADCMLISRNSKDAIKKRFIKSESGFVPNFYLVYDGLKYMLYTNTNREVYKW